MKYSLVLLPAFIALAICEVVQLPKAQSEYVTTKQDMEETAAALDAMRNDYKSVRSNAYTKVYNQRPTSRATPHSASAINQLTKNMKKLRKNLLKPQELPAGSTPEELMLFQQLLSGLKRTSRRKDARAAMHEANQEQIDAVGRLTEQMHEVANTLESPEVNALHDHAHGQSQLLHRMTHVMDAMSEEMDTEKKRNYEDMLTTLLHQHLADPDYHDPLHDHLLAHHLTRNHRDEEFVDHLTHHMLYHDLDRRVQHDADYNAAVGSVIGMPLVQKEAGLQQANRAELDQRVAAYHQQNTASAAHLNRELAQRTNNPYKVASRPPMPLPQQQHQQQQLRVQQPQPVQPQQQPAPQVQK